MEFTNKLPQIHCQLISEQEYQEMNQYSQAAYLSGLVRKVRQQSAFESLKLIAQLERLDMTAILAARIAKGIWKINFSCTLFNECFATKGRDASNKSKDFDRVHDIISRYQECCLDYTEACISSCKRDYSLAYKIPLRAKSKRSKAIER